VVGVPEPNSGGAKGMSVTEGRPFKMGEAEPVENRKSSRPQFLYHMPSTHHRIQFLAKTESGQASIVEIFPLRHFVNSPRSALSMPSFAAASKTSIFSNRPGDQVITSGSLLQRVIIFAEVVEQILRLGRKIRVVVLLHEIRTLARRPIY